MKDADKIFTDGDINDALIKKAVGFDVKETVEEYAESEGEIKLTKKRVTTKFVPPDVSALKMLMERVTSLSDYTDEELLKERERLLALLKKESDKPKSKKTLKKRQSCKKTKKEKGDT